MKTSFYKNLFISIILYIGISHFAQAQVGKTFWFVAPEVTYGHNDTGALLRITALDQDAYVTISLPANSDNFTPIDTVISAGKQVKVELDAYRLLIENGSLGTSANKTDSDWTGWTAGTPFNKGILIESDYDITAYYEIANSSNPDRFTLKGDNALGTEFYIPSQNVYESYPLNPLAREKIDIVATEDNTIIKFTLTDNVNGHVKNTLHTITLNRGQSYCLRRIDGDASNSLGGSHITSNKPIAITISDDSIRHPGEGHYDLVGDQLVPVNVIGREYVVVNTMYGNTRTSQSYKSRAQKVFVVATKNNTVVKVNGVSLTPTLNAGGMLSFDISNKHFDFIESNHDIYVYQFASVGYELGSALVPSIKCTGSTSVSISRIYDGMFAVQIITQKKNLGKFSMLPNIDRLNLNDNSIWHRVEGSVGSVEDDTWYAAVIDMNASTNKVYTITNSGLFHLSVLDANGSSMSYGYFSSFNNLRIDGPTMACMGEDVILSTAQSPSTLTWYYDDGVTGAQEIAKGENSIIAQEEGEYWVEQAFQGCFATDRINVKFNRPSFTLGGDTAVCYDPSNSDITLTAITTPADAAYSYQWGAPFESNTSSSLTFTPDPGTIYKFSLTATTTDDLMCQYTDSAEIVVKSIPVVTWNLPSGQEEICLGEIIALEDIQDDFTYQWFLDGVELVGATEPFYEPTVSGLYEVAITTIEECTVVESRPITVRPNPTVTLADAAECPGDPHTFSLSGYSSYEWFDGSTSLGTNATLTRTEPISELVVKVSNAFGCFATDTAEFKWHNEHVFTFGKDTSLCQGMDMTIEIDPGFTNYKWRFNGAVIPSSGANNPIANAHILQFTNTSDAVEGTYSITAQDPVNGCPVEGDFTLEVLPPVDFTLTYDEKNGRICEGDSIKLVPGNDNNRPFTTFNWFQRNVADWDPINPPVGGKDHLIVMEEGEFMLEAIQDNNCSAESNPLSVDVNESPDFRLTNARACPGDDLELVVFGYVNKSGTIPDGEFSHIVWRNFSGDPDVTTYDAPRPRTSKIVDEGNHVVIVYDSLGCFTAKNATAEYYITPDITIEDASFCDGEGYILPIPTDNNINSHVWTKEGTPISGTVYEGGEYILTAITLDDCEVVNTIQLTSLPSPTPTLPPQSEICEGESISIETERSQRSYQWYHEGVAITGETNASITPTIDGEYSVQVIARNGCEALAVTQVIIRENPTVDLGPDQTVCPGETVTRTIGDYDRIVWSSGERDVKTATLNYGLHTVRVTNQFGCVGTDQVRISWHPLPQFSLGEDLILCPTELPVNIEGPPGFVEYEWHSEAFKLSETMIQGNIMDTVNILKVRDSNNCWAMDTKIITLHPEPEYIFGGDIDECDTELELIAGDIFSVDTSDGIETTPVISYDWRHNNSTTPNVLVSESGQYVVRASDGCWFKTDTFNVRMHPNPVITGLDTMVYARVTVLTDPNLGTQPFTYTLNDGNPQEEKTFNKVENGEHTVWVEDIYGCTDFRIFQFNSNLDDLEIPNFFTPNGDGVNDRWIIKGLEKVPESDIRIYDRYGKLLIRYQASEIEGWDGTYLNSPVPSDDYWYVIHLKPIDKIVKGNVTIKR